MLIYVDKTKNLSINDIMQNMQINDRVKVELIPTGNIVRDLYKGWTHTYGNAVNGQTGVIKEIKKYEHDNKEERISYLVEFDNQVVFKGHNREVTLNCFHFSKYELNII